MRSNLALSNFFFFLHSETSTEIAKWRLSNPEEVRSRYSRLLWDQSGFSLVRFLEAKASDERL